jgi:hypothetical protein
MSINQSFPLGWPRLHCVGNGGPLIFDRHIVFDVAGRRNSNCTYGDGDVGSRNARRITIKIRSSVFVVESDITVQGQMATFVQVRRSA